MSALKSYCYIWTNKCNNQKKTKTSDWDDDDYISQL